jgi:hypothetical protein
MKSLPWIFGGMVALLLAASPASALESCYQICTPSVSCATPCIDPSRPYLGPLACGAGFSCNRSQVAALTNDDARLAQPDLGQAHAAEDGRGDIRDSSTGDPTLVGRDSRACHVDEIAFRPSLSQ